MQPQGFADGIARAPLGMLGVLAVLKEPRIRTLFGGLREAPAVQTLAS